MRNLVGAFLCSVLLAAPHPLTAGSGGRITFLPGHPLPLRLTANQEEPRTGITKQIGASRLALNIGAGYDLLELRMGDDSLSILRFGGEIFTYALTTSVDGFRLQVDAVDGFFGGHALLRMPDREGETFFRIRILHLSSHAVDGHLSPATGMWRDGRAPIPFTKDFGEWTAGRKWYVPFGHVSAYGGISYATLIRPPTLERWSFHAGGEIVDRTLIPVLFGRCAQLYGAVHTTLRGIPAWIGTVDVEAGVRLGEWNEGGVRIYGSFRSGSELFAQYYDLRARAFSLGIAFDLW